jgi:hypothetical protein
MDLDFPSLVPRFDTILSRGLCSGVGTRTGQMCIEAAICAVLGEPHGDKPSCVTSSVRAFKICLNDANWSSAEARAKGLRAVGIAQLGSKGTVDDIAFSTRIAELTIRILLPRLLRDLVKTPEALAAALRCEQEGTQAAAESAAESAARSAGSAADTYLILSADICLQVLCELQSPGAVWYAEHGA